MKALVGAFNQEKALVGAFSVIVKTGCETDGALHSTNPGVGLPVDRVPHQNQRRPLQLAARVDESLCYNGIRGEGFLGVEI